MRSGRSAASANHNWYQLSIPGNIVNIPGKNPKVFVKYKAKIQSFLLTGHFKKLWNLDFLFSAI